MRGADCLEAAPDDGTVQCEHGAVQVQRLVTLQQEGTVGQPMSRRNCIAGRLAQLSPKFVEQPESCSFFLNVRKLELDHASTGGLGPVAIAARTPATIAA